MKSNAMRPKTMNRATNHLNRRLRAGVLAAGLLVGSTALAACGGNSSSNPLPTTAVAATGSPVLPVTSNPISNDSTIQALTIDSVLVENNVDAAGKAVTDHLEIALTNTGTAEVSAFEVYYTFTDATTNTTESYYAELPANFTIPAGGKRIAHFDNTGAVDHFPVSDFSLYYTDINPLEVTVTVGATGTAVQTVTVQKDAGGAEAAD